MAPVGHYPSRLSFSEVKGKRVSTIRFEGVKEFL